MKTFAGIPAGRVEVTPLPNLFWTELLPEIDDLAEAQVTLRVFYLLHRKKGSPRTVSVSELTADSILRRALSQNGQEFGEALGRGLDKAHARGTLFCVESQGEKLYFFNTSEGRKLADQIERGETVLGPEQAQLAPLPAVEPPNIYRAYEKYFGVLTPHIAEELKAAEQEYPPERILDAFRIAREQNGRTWSYVRKILLNWTREEQHETTGRYPKKRKPRFQGKFADLVKRRGGG